MNNTCLVGRLTKDPELQKTPAGLSYCRFMLAVKRPFTADKTDFLPCKAWKQAADYLCQYGHKGDTAAVSGCLTSDIVEQDGMRKAFYAVECAAVNLLTRSQNAPQNAAKQPKETQWTPPPGSEQFPPGRSYKPQEIDTGGISSDDLPF